MGLLAILRVGARMIPYKAITLKGGKADGKTMRVQITRKWVCVEHPLYDQSTGQLVQLDLEQYAPDDKGDWVPIDNTHPLYIL